MFEQNKAFTKIFTAAAQQTGLNFDQGSMSLSGKVNGYDVSVIRNRTLNITIQYSVRRNGQIPDANVIKEARKETLGVVKTMVVDNKVCFLLGSGTDNLEINRIVGNVNRLSRFFSENGFQNVCENCGTYVDEASYYRHGGEVNHFCSSCASEAEQILTNRRVAMASVKENTLLGLLGAMLGSLAGVALIVALGWLGFTASIAGIILAVGTLMGYKKLGGKLSVKGIVISIIVMLIMTYLANRLVMTLYIYRVLVDMYDNVSMRAIFVNMSVILNEFGLTDEYLLSILMLYGFMFIGAFPTIRKNYVESRDVEKMLEDSAA